MTRSFHFLFQRLIAFSLRIADSIVWCISFIPDKFVQEILLSKPFCNFVFMLPNALG